MELDGLVESLDYTLNSRRKRHIVGGFCISISLLFGGLAFTVLTIKEEKNGK